MDHKGKIVAKDLMPAIDDDKLLKAYKDMLFARTADLQIVSYQRQGEGIYTYPPNYGPRGYFRGCWSTDSRR